MKSLVIVIFTIFSFSSVACVQKGIIKSVITNSNYAWFKLDNGFTIRQIHNKPLTHLLYHAAATKDEVCVTEMNLDASGPTWGIPRAITVNKI